jgi:serine/threonine protein kinase
VSKGLFYLHENSVVHRDVKIENILLGGDEDQCYKLCDFGSCVQTKKLVVDSNNRQFIFEDLDANTTP